MSCGGDPASDTVREPTQVKESVSDSAVPFLLTCDALIEAQKCDLSLAKLWTAVTDTTVTVQ